MSCIRRVRPFRVTATALPGVLVSAVSAVPRVAAPVVVAVAVVPAVVVSVVVAVARVSVPTVNMVLAVFVVPAVFVVLTVFVVVTVIVPVAGGAVIRCVTIRTVPVVNAVGRVAVVAVGIDQRQAVRLGGGPDGEAGKTQYRG
jgi:hypothetical protein